ncbi:MAG TPA: NAD(P)H-dependent glycerol-3-phosphate dehydrogenase [Planctomycetota bacterium]
MSRAVSLVLGDGGWGTAIAMALHRAGREVRLWSHDAVYAAEVARTRENGKFLAGVEIPAAIDWMADADKALDDVVEFYSVIPTQFLRPTLRRFAGALAGVPAVSASKGLELDTFRRPTEILAEATGCEQLAILSGPSHAEEVALGLATSVVVASTTPGLAERVQERIASDSFRVYTSGDPLGVELGGALKNVVAVAAGVSDGLGLGDNAKAALVSRGLVEIARFGAALGADRETFFGLSGAGDLMVTCYSRHSRNRALGERIGAGEKLDDILAASAKVAEGVWTCKAVHAQARALEVDMPITAQLHAILFGGRPALEAVRELMLRPSRAEQDVSA